MLWAIETTGVILLGRIQFFQMDFLRTQGLKFLFFVSHFIKCHSFFNDQSGQDFHFLLHPKHILASDVSQ